ncbi:MAG: SufD family Fe-S cluster assembly protein, partial [Solirubrobacterales bacterium]
RASPRSGRAFGCPARVVLGSVSSSILAGSSSARAGWSRSPTRDRISKDGGRASYRGLLEVAPGATGAKSKVVCDALLLDEDSRSDTYPTIRIDENDADVGHEATVSKIGDEQLFYLQSHGLDEEEASKMIVNGFIEPITKELPMEYAVEMNRLIELQMEGSIG